MIKKPPKHVTITKNLMNELIDLLYDVDINWIAYQILSDNEGQEISKRINDAIKRLKRVRTLCDKKDQR